jgi:hypothetical protein
MLLAKIEHLSGVLFTYFGLGETNDGEFLQKLDSEWALFERYWQFCSGPYKNLATERQLGVPHTCRSRRSRFASHLLRVAQHGILDA